jgi:predicted component of type VI protein secretion system
MADFTFVEKRPMAGHEHSLDADVVVGREGCEVVLADPEVSRRHAALRKTPGGAAVEDLGSTNGTFVNGTRITGLVELSDGDVVRFGNTEWELRSAANSGTVAGNVGGPQVTAARSVPAAEPATAAQATPPAPPAPQPAAPAAPAAAAAAAPAAPPAGGVAPQLGDIVGPGLPGEGRRGDVPLPPEVTPSAIRRTLPPEAASAPPQFAPSNPRRTSGSAATRGGYTLFCLIITALAVAGLIVYFALQ